MTGAAVTVRFYEAYAPYNAGEVAGKPYAEAAELVAAGIAVYLDPPPGLDEQGQPLPGTETEAETRAE